METENLKPLSSFTFIPLIFFIFMRPFISGLAYPAFETYYESFIILISVAALLFSVYSASSKNTAQAKIQARPKTNAYILPASLLLLSYIISAATSVNIHNSFGETLKFLSYISVFFIVSQADNRQKTTLIKIIIIAASMISLYSIYQYFWGYQHTIDYIRKTDSRLLSISPYTRDILLSKRSIGTFPSPNILGGYLLMAFFLSLYLYFSSRKVYPAENRQSPRALSGVIPIAIILAALVLTKSLGAWLSLVFTLIILTVIMYDDFKKQKWLIYSSCVFIFLVLVFILSSRWERLVNLNNPQNSIIQRLNYWSTAIGVIKDHLFSGVGAGNFQEVFLKYKVGLSTNTRYAHNIFLHQWVETGILGFAGIFFMIFNLLRRKLKDTGEKFIFLAAIAFIMHNMIDNAYFMPETGIFLWALLAILSF